MLVSIYLLARSVVNAGKEDAPTNSLKLKRSLCVKKRESGIFSVRTKSQNPILFIRSIFSPFISADEQIDHIKSDLAERKHFIASVTEQDRAAHREFLDRLAHAPNMFHDLYEITDDCIGCGVCTKVCPKKCFHMEGQKSIWNKTGCISCMACIHACPMLAIQLKMPEKNPRARYRNENVSLCEIVDANNQWVDARE